MTTPKSRPIIVKDGFLIKDTPFDSPVEYRIQKSCIWERRINNSGKLIDSKGKDSRIKNKIEREEFLIIGFDSEYKTPNYSLSNYEIKEGLGKYEVLSYQFYSRSFEESEWCGILIPEKGERISFGQFILFALLKGIESGDLREIPESIYLVGHFTRADVPAFSDFHDLTSYLGNVRNTFVSIDQFIPLKIQFSETEFVEIKIYLRDTMLLSPANTKKLSDLGELVGTNKVVLDEDPTKELFYKKNMDLMRDQNWDLFKKYALVDAEICVRYILKIMEEFFKATGKRKVPVTLTSIGIELLLKSWKDDLGLDKDTILGNEIVHERTYNKKLGWFLKTKKEVPIAEVYWFKDFVTETYHGGRNEQFWFGPGFEDEWTDFDLSGAYPTAMALIGKPDWENIFVSKRLDDYKANELGFAYVNFKFPKHTRYPTLPVRTENGLIFPLEDMSYCSTPEIEVARSLGAIIRVRHGVIVPTDKSVKIFGHFISECIKKRRLFPKKSIDALFWKELSNSTYGKTAQGLREKRVFDLREKNTQRLPESRITNPYFASYITSFVRATLGEIINSIPNDKMIFNATTDGFLTNATADEIERATYGLLSRMFGSSRESLTGQFEVVEIKHKIRKPLGWRTRGQATLIAGEKKEEDKSFHIVLAKGGIYTKNYWDLEGTNNEIVDLFFNRTPETTIDIESKTGVRDMVFHDADLVEKYITKRLNMEFDWKRGPNSVIEIDEYAHLAFSTRPWNSFEDFETVKRVWEEYTNDGNRCLKTIEDFSEFSKYAEAKMGTDKAGQKYLKRKDGDLNKLKLSLCNAYRVRTAGFDDIGKIPHKDFSQILNECGVPCKPEHLDYSKKRPFKLNDVPRTIAVLKAMKELKKHFPKLDQNSILSNRRLNSTFTESFVRKDVFTDRLTSPK
ncbi:MAG: DNA polymerase [Alphaproteobacteria bacterium]